MNNEVAQVVALTAFGNAALKGENTGSFLETNVTAHGCQKIRFIDLVPNGILVNHFEKQPIAEDFESWINFLKESMVEFLWLHYVPSKKTGLLDRFSSAFVGGGGGWIIEAKHGNKSDFWQGRWRVTDSKSKDRRIWTATYARFSKNDVVKIPDPTVITGIKTNLEKAILSCKEFSQHHNLDPFYKCFANAEHCLIDSNFSTDSGYFEGIIPSKYYSLEARQILIACGLAWVFGGMGSWNDMGFKGKDQKIYDKISEQLYCSICEAIVYATNSFAR